MDANFASFERRVNQLWIATYTCVRSSGLPVGSHGIVVRWAQKSGEGRERVKKAVNDLNRLRIRLAR